MNKLLRNFVISAWATYALAASCGCATSVPAGIGVAQKGLAVLDIASDRAVDEYAAAVSEAQEFCHQLQPPHDDKCLATRGVAPEDVAKATAAFADLAKAYDLAAEALGAMLPAWEALAPELERAKALRK